MCALVHERRRGVLRGGGVLARESIEDRLVFLGILGVRPSMVWPEPRVKYAPSSLTPGSVRAATKSASAGS